MGQRGVDAPGGDERFRELSDAERSEKNGVRALGRVGRKVGRPGRRRDQDHPKSGDRGAGLADQ